MNPTRLTALLLCVATLGLPISAQAEAEASSTTDCTYVVSTIAVPGPDIIYYIVTWEPFVGPSIIEPPLIDLPAVCVPSVEIWEEGNGFEDLQREPFESDFGISPADPCILNCP